MNSNMRAIEDEINNPDFGIISISIDPENDTPELLKQHAKRIGVKSPNWHFLTGNRDYIGKVADQFDIYVGDKEDEGENLNHSGMIPKSGLLISSSIALILLFITGQMVGHLLKKNSTKYTFPSISLFVIFLLF